MGDEREGLRFYLGTHHPHWLARTDVPLFISRRWLTDRKTLPTGEGRWALDSGGFTELSLYGEWRTTPEKYCSEVDRFAVEMPHLDWVAPQDWMCEPFILTKTGLTVEEHQRRTVENFEMLRQSLGYTVIPVLQGFTRDEYHECWEMYGQAGFDLEREEVVGLGSICRRQNMQEAGHIVRSLGGLRLHAFGVKLTGLRMFGDALVSADSTAWSYRARRQGYPLPGCVGHKNCCNCMRFALRWRDRVEGILSQLTLEAV